MATEDYAEWDERMEALWKRRKRQVKRMAGKLKIAYHVLKEEGREKPFWNRIGKVFTNKDGSLSAILNYLPPCENGEYRIQIRDYEPKEKKEANSFEE